jgi:hypothetical protein
MLVPIVAASATAITADNDDRLCPIIKKPLLFILIISIAGEANQMKLLNPIQQ